MFPRVLVLTVKNFYTVQKTVISMGEYVKIDKNMMKNGKKVWNSYLIFRKN